MATNNFVLKQSAGAATSENDSKTLPLSFTPLKIKGVTLKNRLVVSPMCMYSSQDGFMSDFHLAHLGAFALKGVAVVFTEGTAVNPEGRISSFDAGLWKDEHIPKMKQIVDFIHSHGSLAGIQLAHAGRKSSTAAPHQITGPADHGTLDVKRGGWKEIYGPSPIPYDATYATPIELSTSQIQSVVESFKKSAVRANEAGFDILEIHGGHGYLISSFLSPLTNTRTDKYGGSFENRIRVLIEIIQAISSVWPSTKPFWLRISCTEWADGGWNIDDSVKLAKIVKDMGIDLMDCSSGANVAEQKFVPSAGFQVPPAAQVKKEASIATGAVGGLRTGAVSEKVLKDGAADLIFVAREALRNSGFVLSMAEELGVDVDWPKQYMYGKKLHW